MNILVVTGSCLSVNSSANLCHVAYINGLVNLGYSVDLISVDEKDHTIDNNIKINGIDNHYKYYGKSIYELMSDRKKIKVNASKIENDTTDNIDLNKSKLVINRMVNSLKKYIRNLYGVHGPIKVWYHKAKKFSTTKKYDYIISLAYPPISHLLVKRLLDKKQISSSYWIQIWEDPWSTDLCITDKNKKIYKEEKKLISYADKVYYVSPITLSYQKRLFCEYKDKMDWKPLPYYYKNIQSSREKTNKKEYTYGYFGDYVPYVRNLSEFYKVAKYKKIKVNICGNPQNLFEPTENIKIWPRLTLEELTPIENNTDVLIFLCNLNGGQIPGKIYQYSSTDKIILFILDGTKEEKAVIREYFETFNRYVFCDNTEESISQAIEKIESHKIEEIINEPLEAFSPSNIIKQIIESCKEE